MIFKFEGELLMRELVADRNKKRWNFNDKQNVKVSKDMGTLFYHFHYLYLSNTDLAKG